MKSVILATVALAALTLSANAESRLQQMADNLAMEPQALPSRPLIPVQTFDPEACKARCQRTYDYCHRLVDNLANGPLRGDANLLQLQRDRCETNYENCVHNCLR
jgi:hypothetical protein